MRGKIKVSVIYVNYKCFKELKESIASINKYKPKTNYQIIVVDNEAKSEIEKYCKGKSNIKYIKASKNLGYAAGNNLSAKYANGEYILVLNPDTILDSNVIDELAGFLDENSNTAIAAPVLIDNKGKVIQQIAPRKITPLNYIFTYTFMAKLLPKNKIRERFLHEVSDSNKPYEVDVVPGSVLMIRKSIFEKLSGFDEGYFMYFEDNDLCDRAKHLGYKIFKIQSAKVIHDWKPGEGNKKLKTIFEKSRYYYFKKHFGFINALIVEIFSRKWWRFYEK